MPNDYPVEDKAKFVAMLNDALVECGAGRYDYLRDTPMTYVKDGASEHVVCGHRRANVRADSLPAIMADLYRQNVL